MDKKVEQILLGSMVGDGAILINKCCKNAHYEETHNAEQKEYLDYKKQILSSNLNFSTHFSNKKKYPNKIYYTIYSRVNPLLTNLRNTFYPNNVRHKIISQKILDKLNWLGIAVWFCDDGTYCYTSKTIRFSVGKQYHQICINYFEKLGFNFKSSNYNLSLNSKQTSIFIKKIKIYILRMPLCIHYKIGLDFEKLFEFNQKNKIRNKLRKPQKREYMKLYYRRPEVANRRVIYEPMRKIRDKLKIDDYQKEYASRLYVKQRRKEYYKIWWQNNKHLYKMNTILKRYEKICKI